jgi:quinol monooxygenase YgiN
MDIIVQHTVRDYDAWKPAFDEHEATRAKYGCTGHTIYRDPDNRNDLTILTSWRSRDDAQRFMEDPSLKAAMEKGGVTSEPRVTLLEEADSRRYAASRAA